MSLSAPGKKSSKLLEIKVKNPATDEWIDGYPICARTKNGENSYWIVRTSCSVEELTTGGLVHLKTINAEEAQPNFLRAKAESFATGERVEGYPFRAKAETEESSYWLIREGCTIDQLLTYGLVNIIPETIVYEDR